jgi:hypothetical protein
MNKKYNSIFQTYDTCEHCSKNCKTEGIGKLFCPEYSRVKTEKSGLMKSAVAIALFLLLTAGFSYAADWKNPSMFLLTNPPIEIAQVTSIPLENILIDKNFIRVSIPEDVAKEQCLINGQVPPWVTVNPSDPLKTLYQGELVEMNLNVGKPGDGSCDTCQYQMQLKSDHSIKWNAIGFSNGERIKRQEGK